MGCVIESGLPKVKVESENLFFVEQIKRLVTNDSAITDNYEDADTGSPDIIVSDDISYAGKDNVLLLLKRNDVEKAKKANVALPETTFTIGKCTETQIVEALAAMSTKIIARKKGNNMYAQLASDLTREKERAEDYRIRLQQAGFIQRKIMVPPEQLDDVTVSVVYEAYTDVSGDVFFIKQVYDKIYIMVCDVTDHGYLAGMYGATLYALAENYLEMSSLMEQSIDMWAKYMTKAAKMFHPRNSNMGDVDLIPLTANATFCVIDKGSCMIRFMLLGSGQEPPIIIRGGNEVSPIKVDDNVGAPIGEFESQPKVIQKRFFPGDSVVLYTDGATEIFLDGEKGESVEKDTKKMYSSEKIASSIQKIENVSKASPSGIVSAIINDASAFSISNNLGKDNSMPNITDDLTLACVKWRGNGYD